MNNGDSNTSRLVPWLVGLLFPALVGAAAGLINNLKQHDSRIAVLESQIGAAGHRLENIERKIDRLLEHRN